MSANQATAPGRISSPMSSKQDKQFLLVLAFSFLLQSFLSLSTPGLETDVNCFAAWSDSLYRLGPSEFYTGGFFADYPPGYLYYLWFMAGILQLLGLSAAGGVGLYLLTLLPIFCSLILAWLVYCSLRRQSTGTALLTGSLLALLPPLLYNNSVWKQVDSVFILALVLCFLALEHKKWYCSAVLYGIALLIKPQALFFGPVLAAGFLLPLVTPADIRQDSKDTQAGRLFQALPLPPGRPKICLRIVVCALLSLGTVWIGALPFQGSQDAGWLIRQYGSAAATYPYASVNAFNLFAGLGGNWVSWDTKWIFSCKAWGILFLCLSTLLLFLAAWRRRKEQRGNLILLAALYGMAVFTLGHGMHERYSLPSLIFLLLAWAYTKDRKLLTFSLWQCTFSFVNLTMALSLLENGSLMQNTLFTAVVRLTGLGQTVLLIFLSLYCLNISVINESKGMLAVKLSLRMKKGVSPLQAGTPWGKGDFICMAAVTILGAALSFPGLGNLSAPVTAWQTPGQTVALGLDQSAATLWVYGGIGTGILTLTDETGAVLVQASMEEGNLFNWAVYRLPPFQGRLTLSASDSAIVYELAFTDANGASLPVAVSPGGELLFDEQSLRPEHIDHMSGMYFDEIYHGRTAFEYLNGLEPYETTHPPLGKELIGTGITLFGMNPFGWRFMGTLFGVLMLPLIYTLARLLTGRLRFGLLASILLGLDFMRFTQSRIATIDVYSVFFIMLSFLGMLLWLRMDICRTPLSRQLPALALSGLALGLSCAVKWTGVYAGAGLALMFFLSLWDTFRDSQYKKRLFFISGCCILFFVLLPVSIYAGSYLIYFIQGGKPFTWEALWLIQENMYAYHSGLAATHPFASRCFSWPLIIQPVWYSLARLLPPGLTGSIAVLGNPAVWWTGLAALVLMAFTLLRSRDRTARFLLIAYCAQFIPWIFISRLQFLYHYFGCVPILVLAIVYLLYRISFRYPRISLYAGWVISAAALILFLLFYPVLSGLAVPTEYISWLQWFPGWIFGA